jgi:hypothetical protein
MSINKDISNRMLIGQSRLQSGDDEPQIFDVYQLVPDLPNATNKRDVCFEHIRDSVAQDLVGDFYLEGVHFPERGEPQEITTQLSCKGASCVMKICGLTITQYDTDGKILTQGNFTS